MNDTNERARLATVIGELRLLRERMDRLETAVRELERELRELYENVDFGAPR